jgi:hypothetical protein
VVVSKTKQPLDDQTPAEGKHLFIKRVNMPPSMNDSSPWISASAFELITVVDYENHRLAWINLLTPFKFILRAERWQWLTVTEDGKTKYETIEVFGGLLAWVLMILMKSWLDAGFKAMGEALKRRSEEH